MKKLIAQIKNTKDYENLNERLGDTLGSMIYKLIEEVDNCGEEKQLLEENKHLRDIIKGFTQNSWNYGNQR